MKTNDCSTRRPNLLHVQTGVRAGRFLVYVGRAWSRISSALGGGGDAGGSPTSVAGVRG